MQGQGEAQLVDAGSWCEEKGRLETQLSQEVGTGLLWLLQRVWCRYSFGS